ncbi:hypothetical protein SAMN05216227_10121, partial [Pseudorhodobacter antarcticus]
PGRVIYDWRHYLAVVQRKPGALRNGAPFVEMPEPFRVLQAKMLRQPGGDREMVDILSLVLHHDEQAVLCAVEMALEAGVPTKTHVLNLLHRLLDGKLTDQPDVNPPASRRNSSVYFFAIPYLLHSKYCSKETGTKTGQDQLFKLLPA